MRLLPILLCLLPLLATASPPLRICYDDWPPYASYDASRGHHGFSISVLRDLFNRLQRPLRFQSATQSRCLAAARQGQIDIMLFGDRETLPGWSGTQIPLEFWLVAAWVPEASPFRQFDGVARYHGLRVGLVDDYVYPAAISDFHGWRVSRVSDAINGLRQLSARRIDVMFEDALWGERMRQQHGLQIRSLRPLLSVVPQYHLFRPGLEAELQRFEQALQAQADSGELERLYRQRLGISYRELRHASPGHDPLAAPAGERSAP